MKYGKLVNGQLTYVNSKFLTIGNKHIVSPTDAQLAEAGIYQVEDIMEDGTITIEDGVIKNYIGSPNELDAVQAKINSINGQLSDTDPLMQALERLIAANGVTAEDKAMASSRIALRDELGKVVQTDEGDGTAFNPYTWTEGKSVVKDAWYKTPNEYIWQAIADGIPASETDNNYFDVVGL